MIVLTSTYRVYKTYQDFLLIRHDYPLSPIYSTKNLAKKISGDRERENKVNFTGPENKTAILKNLTVKLETFGDWYWKLLDELKRLQVDLFGGVGFEDEEWLSVTVPDPLLDEPNLSSPGFCFGDVERNDLGRYNDAGLRTLLHHPRLKDRFGAMLPGGRFIPNAVGCHDFLERSSRARSKLATLLHISCGGPARGTELTSHYLRNHPQGDIRNVMVIDGRLCLVAGYNKSSSTVSLCPSFHYDSYFNVLFLDRETKEDIQISAKKSLPRLHSRLVCYPASGDHACWTSRTRGGG